MFLRKWATGAALASLLLLVPAVAGAGVLRQIVHGRLVAVDASSHAAGQFHIGGADHGANMFERIDVQVKRLGAAQDATGHFPDFHVFLVDSGATTEADFGSMRVGGRGNKAGFRFDTRHDTMPASVTSIRDFGGGTIEVRESANVVLRGSIPAFVDPSGGHEHGSRAFARDASRLRPTTPGDPERGIIEAQIRNRPRGTDQRVLVECAHLPGGRHASFTVVAIDGSNVETVIGTFMTNRRGYGRLGLNTARGDTIPGGGVVALSGQNVEVRDGNGVALLAGHFPTLP